jgi:hypothetical protein
MNTNPNIIITRHDGTTATALSYVTWHHFAYFRNVMRDQSEGGTVEMIFMDDFEDLWDFLTYDLPKRKVDFAVHVKELCNIMGLDDDQNFICGRLLQLLTDAALQYVETYHTSSCTHMTLSTFVSHIEARKEFSNKCMAAFHARSSIDPRCVLHDSER